MRFETTLSTKIGDGTTFGRSFQGFRVPTQNPGCKALSNKIPDKSLQIFSLVEFKNVQLKFPPFTDRFWIKCPSSYGFFSDLFRLNHDQVCAGRLYLIWWVMGWLWDDHFRDLGYPSKLHKVQDAGFDNVPRGNFKIGSVFAKAQTNHTVSK